MKPIKGHGLDHEGATTDRLGNPYHGAFGPGECQCGAKSPPLPSDNARKAWHREHKATVEAQR